MEMSFFFIPLQSKATFKLFYYMKSIISIEFILIEFRAVIICHVYSFIKHLNFNCMVQMFMWMSPKVIAPFVPAHSVPLGVVDSSHIVLSSVCVRVFLLWFTSGKFGVNALTTLTFDTETELEWDPSLRGSLRRPKGTWNQMAFQRGYFGGMMVQWNDQKCYTSTSIVTVYFVWNVEFNIQ